MIVALVGIGGNGVDWRKVICSNIVFVDEQALVSTRCIHGIVTNKHIVNMIDVCIIVIRFLNNVGLAGFVKLYTIIE